MKYLVIIVSAVALAIHWGEAGFLALCAAGFVVLKIWERDQVGREDHSKTNQI